MKQTITIFGRSACGFCIRAKDLCEIHNLAYRYVDIEKEGITQADLEKTVGKPVQTVPQVFHGKQYIGGFEQLKQWIDSGEDAVVAAEAKRA